MDPINLYTLRYRSGALGVSTGYLVASSLRKAEEVGQAWCNSAVNRRYIGVIPAILADESILDSPVVQEIEEMKSITTPTASTSTPNVDRKKAS